MMMMKLEGELYAARLRLDGLAAKSNRITCRPALVAGTCALGCQSTYWVCLRHFARVLEVPATHPVAAVGQGSRMIPAIWGRE